MDARGQPPTAGDADPRPAAGEPGGLPPDVEPTEPLPRPAPPTAAVGTPTPSRVGRLVGALTRAASHVMALGLLATAHTLSFVVLLVSLSLIGLCSLPYTQTGSRWLLRVVPGLQVGEVRGVLFGDFEVDELSYPIGSSTLVIRRLAWRGLDLTPPGQGQSDWTLAMASLSADEVRLQGGGDDKPLVLPTELTLPLAIRAARVEVDKVFADALGAEPIRGLRGAISLGAGSGARHRVDDLRLSWDRLDASGRASLGAGAPLPLDATIDLAPRAGTPGTAAPSAGTTPPPLADAWQATIAAQGPLADFGLTATARARGQSLDAQARVRLQDRLPLAHLLARLSGLDLAAFATGLPTTALSGDILADLGVPAARPGGPSASGPTPAAAALPISVHADLHNDRPARWDQGGLPLRRLELQARSDVQAPLRGQVQRLDIEFAGNAAPPVAAPPAAAAPAASAPTAVSAARPADAASANRHPVVGKPSRTVVPAAVAAGSLSGRGSWALTGDTRHLSLQTDATLSDVQTALLDTRAPNLIVSGPLQLGYDHTLGAADTAVAAPVARPAASASAAAAAARPQAPAASSPPLVAPSAHAMGPRLTLSTDLSGRLSRYPPGGARTRGVAEARRVTLGIAAGEPPPDSRNDWPLVRLRLKAAAQASGIDIEQIDAQSGTARLRGGGHLRHLGAAWQLALQTTLDDFDPTLWWPGAVDTPWQRGPHRLAGELQAELSLTDRALAASPDTLARLANLSGQTRLRLRSSVLAGVPVAGTLDLQAGAPMATPLAAVPASNGPLDGTTHPRVQVTADISVGERALSDSGMNPGGVGLTLRGQLDPLGRDDRWQLGWQARSLEALAPWLRLAGIGLALDGDVHGELEASGRWPQLRSHGRLTSEHLLTRSRPVIEPDSTAAARTTSLALDNLHASWTVGSAGSDPLSVDLSLDRLNAAGISGAEFHGVQLAVRGSGAAHQLSLRSRWVRTPAAPPASGTNGGAGGNASPGGGSPPRAGATASGVRPAAVAAAAGRTAGAPASSAEPDSVVPRHWLLAMDATGGWSSTPLAALATTLGDGRGTAKRPDAPADSGQVSWQGRIDQLLLNELVIDANGTPVTTSIPIPGAGAGPAGQAAVVSTSSIGPARAAPTATATSAETRAVPRAPVGAAAPVSAAAGPAPGTGSAWVIGLAPTSLGLGFGGGETRVLLGPTRLRLAELSLAIDGFSWRSRAAQAEPDIELRARIEPLNVAPLLARAQPGFGWRGDLQLGGRLALQSSADAIDVDIELARLGGDLVVIDPDNPAGPQRLDLRQFKLALQGRQGVWTLSEQVDGANLGSLVGQQTVRSASAAQWPGRLDPVAGQLDLQVAQLGNWGRWLPAGWRLSGRLTTQARIAGRLGAPELSGELVGQQIAVRNGLQGVDWNDARLRVTLAGEVAHIDELVVKGGAGTLKGTGQLRLGHAPGVQLSLTADHFAALQRIDRKVVVSGNAELTVDARATTIKGKLRADEGRIDVSQGDAPGLADDVIVSRPEADAAAARDRSAAPRSRRGLALDIGADLGENFELTGRGITTNLAGVLQVSSPNDRIAITGTIRAVDGNYAAYGQKLSIDRGLITFGGPAENPRLDIRATRPDLDDVKVGVEITGTAQNPRVRLFSEPEMSNTDKLSWLLLGRASDGLGSTDLSLLQRAAFSLLAGESDSPSIIQRLGLDQLGVRQTEGTTARETIVSLGKQLSRRWYVGYERSLNAATGSWQLIYRLAQRFTLRAQSGVDNAVDLIWTWRWGEGETPRPAGTQPPRPADPAASRP